LIHFYKSKIKMKFGKHCIGSLFIQPNSLMFVESTTTNKPEFIVSELY